MAVIALVVVAAATVEYGLSQTHTATTSSSSSSSSSQSSTNSSPSSTTSSTTTPTSAPPGNRFIRIRALTSNSAWDLPNYNAQQVLQMIAQLHPDVLERYISGPQNINAPVPVAAGEPQMTAGEFLNASASACGCYIIPRLTLADYSNGTLLQAAQGYLSLPIFPRLHYLSLDNWGAFAANHTQAQITGMFQELYAQGWWGIGVNDCGGVYTTYGYATWADFCISTNGWVPNSSQLASLGEESNIQLRLLYIDFPNPMAQFMQLPVDQEGSVLSSVASAQQQEGYLFVYPILQSSWDASARVTSASGPYKGETLFQLMAALMNQYNQG